MKTIIILIILFFGNTLFGNTVLVPAEYLSFSAPVKESDTLFKANYPEGIYYTKNDFINKRANNSKAIQMRDFNQQILKEAIHNPFFYFVVTNKKVKNVFAISYNGHLFFQVKAILKNRNKEDRAQESKNPNSFVRTILGGNNYLYTEANLANKWAQGAYYGGIGGAVGGTLANDLIKGKGVVWDFKNQEFNIFKSCKDYNEFIFDLGSFDDIQECKQHQPDIFKVREAMQKVK